MTKKDQSVSENIDLGKEQNENPPIGSKKNNPENHPSDQIKNAHATGDGAYGRSDKSVFAGDEGKGEAQEEGSAY